MLRIAIDGACRRNGKPDCVAAGGVFIQQYRDKKLVYTTILNAAEYTSTNQRGELLALLRALEYINVNGEEAQIITDSEYIFNAMSKEWYDRWLLNGWVTSMGDSVKNSDIWRKVTDEIHACKEAGIEVTFYHIKGHVIPFGKVTAERLLHEDVTGLTLYNEVAKKYDICVSTKADKVVDAQGLSLKNNGFVLHKEVMKDFVVSNVVADSVATVAVEEADRIKRISP